MGVFSLLKMENSSCKFNWNNYIDHVHNNIYDMMNTKDLTDVTLISDDKKLSNAHKLVLKACSSLFTNILGDLPQSNSMIYLRGIQHQEIQAIIDYMYLGEVTISQERVYEFLKVAADLELKNFEKESLDNTSTSEPNVGDYEAKSPAIKSDYMDDVVIANSVPTIQHTNTVIEEDDVSNAKEAQLKMSINSTCETMPKNPQIPKQNPKVYLCKECELSFSKQYNLDRHINTEHTGILIACDQCDETFKRKDTLKEHYKSVHEKIEFVCTPCNYATRFRQSFRMHMKSKHNMKISKSKSDSGFDNCMPFSEL